MVKTTQNSPHIRYLKSIFSVILVVGFFYYLWCNRQILISAFYQLNFKTFFWVSVTFLSQWIVRAKRDQVIFSTLDHKVDLFPIFTLNTLQIALNHLPLKVGTIYTAQLLKKYYKIRYLIFAKSMALQYIFMFIAACFSAGIALLFYTHVWGSVSILVAIVLIVTGFFLTLLLFIKIPESAFHFISVQKIEKVINLLLNYRPRKGHVSVALFYSTICFLLSSWRMALLFNLRDVELSVFSALIIGASMHFSTILSITPGALGIREGSVGIVSTLIFLDISDGVVITTVERSISLLLVILISMITWLPLNRYLNKKK